MSPIHSQGTLQFVRFLFCSVMLEDIWEGDSGHERQLNTAGRDFLKRQGLGHSIIKHGERWDPRYSTYFDDESFHSELLVAFSSPPYRVSSSASKRPPHFKAMVIGSCWSFCQYQMRAFGSQDGVMLSGSNTVTTQSYFRKTWSRGTFHPNPICQPHPRRLHFSVSNKSR